MALRLICKLVMLVLATEQMIPAAGDDCAYWKGYGYGMPWNGNLYNLETCLTGCPQACLPLKDTMDVYAATAATNGSVLALEQLCKNKTEFLCMLAGPMNVTCQPLVAAAPGTLNIPVPANESEADRICDNAAANANAAPVTCQPGLVVSQLKAYPDFKPCLDACPASCAPLNAHALKFFSNVTNGIVGICSAVDEMLCLVEGQHNVTCKGMVDQANVNFNVVLPKSRAQASQFCADPAGAAAAMNPTPTPAPSPTTTKKEMADRANAVHGLLPLVATLVTLWVF